ncbi:MAG TPA: energy-dependent translational throttle protein EttA [Treponemataceae bacterium]|jgi:sulfate-transporting ATPase|nr:energy-dependent translational throttle protein EttA [Spirochaetota bacterium]NMA56459.1 energy-dependent translational throttle protein EttA [Treponema sp.]HOF11639.1 energy-dependent translational throttle protein EttA [Treponemataceae bacterium]HPY52563.1 energy-dependent translational throttle protein EttA [Treponemataceae bacterium]HUH44880.1 energy-dependent translational throttle protein EttA [Treponemataceae bacterium]
MAKTYDDKKIIYSMDRVSRTYGTKTVLKDVSISYFYGAKIGVVGENGSGKSSLLKILAGVDTDFVGETHVSPGYTIGYLEQEPELEKGKTVKEIVSEGVKEITDLLQEFDEVNEAFGDPDADFDKLCNRQADIQEKLDALDAWNLDANLELAMDALRCPPPEQSVDVLSGGEKRRVALCRLLLQKPDILLLDEPTNHLDAETVAWLERHLQSFPGTIIAITHDRYFLDNVAGWILELDRGEGFPYKGNYSGWLEQKKQRLALEEKGESDRQKALQKELDWIQMTPKGRQAKHKEHITKYEQLLNESGREKLRDTKITIPAGPRLGNLVVEAKDLTKGYGERLLFDNLSFTVPAGAIVGIVGPNGAGKTTLFRLIADAAGQTVERLDGTEGGEKPDAGELRVGESVKLTYVDQMRSLLDPEKTVWEQLSDGLDIIKLGAVDEKGRALNGAIREVNSRAYCSWFNFSGSDQQKKVGVLSGGERNRLNLAMMLKQGANLLLLDEPTNDLDVTTMRALEEAIESFAGCAMVISHDRWFLDRICTHILAFENNSEVRWFEGNWSDYAEWRRKELGAEADRPHKTVYRKMTR